MGKRGKTPNPLAPASIDRFGTLGFYRQVVFVESLVPLVAFVVRHGETFGKLASSSSVLPGSNVLQRVVLKSRAV
jgi:hypothetical protein